MIRRVRFASGVTLLAALSLSFVEGVAAAACSAEALPSDPESVGVDAMADMSPVHMDSEDAQGSTDHECPPGHAGGDPEQSEGGPACPFVLPGAPGGCSYAASLPAIVAAVRPLDWIGEHVAPSIERTPAFLKVAAIFRPPIA